MRKRYVFFLFLNVLLVTSAVKGQVPEGRRLAELTSRYAGSSFDALRAFLSLPNDAHFPEHVEQNVVYMERAFQDRGFTTIRLETGGPPLLLAEQLLPNPKRTVLVYLQIDGQPVDSTKWFQESPYKPVLKRRTAGGNWQEIPWASLEGEIDPEWRIFARSASDAKGPVMMFLTALDIARQEGLMREYNLKVIMDFEEEMGSPHLSAAVDKYRDRLAADMLLIFDGPRHVSNRPTLTFGARGIATITLTVYGPYVSQHSGHYGNFVPNPAMRLARLLASMEDDSGRVVIPGFYDGISIDDATREVLAQVPDDETEIMQALGIAEKDRVAPTLQEALQYPSLNIRGMASGWIGEKVRTIIPATATAEIDLRLVPESDAERLIGLIRDHIRAHGYRLLDREPAEAERLQYPRLATFTSRISYQAFRTPYDAEVAIWLTRALRRAFGQEPIRKRMSGGSIPISPFVTTLGIPAVTVPVVNPDNNQHSPNENLRLGNYFEGIRTFLAILSQPFD